MHNVKLPAADFDRLRHMDTCTVSNAIERFNVRLRNEGFASGLIKCRFHKLPPMLGYAVTGRIRTSTAPMAGRCYFDRMDFWEYATKIPAPRVLVLEDVDHTPGVGAMVGEIHASIGQALGFVGHVTNGAVRDLPEVEALGFNLFSGTVVPSHSYAHIVEFGEPVSIGGLKISPGELVHGDCHGIHTIPLSVAADIPTKVAEIMREERELIDFCRSPQFSLEELGKRMAAMTADCATDTYRPGLNPGLNDDTPTRKNH